jgi:hypothetical protein
MVSQLVSLETREGSLALRGCAELDRFRNEERDALQFTREGKGKSGEGGTGF